MESEFLLWLRDRLPRGPQLRLGPGDDAAVLQLGQRAECVVTVDLLTDGVDFELGSGDARRIGRKALAVNLSDLAAMAARPVAAVVALALPREGALALAQQLYEGLLPLAADFDVVIAGGDTNTWHGPLAIGITLIGELDGRQPLVRCGAKPGDAIIVSGFFGGSRLGHQFEFVPRVREAILLTERYSLHGGMDVSDGLSLDLARLAAASGCGAALHLEQIPLSPAAARWAEHLADGSTALDHALADGEDFELLLAVPPADAARLTAEQPLDIPLTKIGEFVAEPGLWKVDAAGERSPLAAHGYIH